MEIVSKRKLDTLRTIFYITLLVALGAVATGVVTLVFMILTVMLTWIWLVFPQWAAICMTVTFCVAIATEIYLALYDVEKNLRCTCRRCRQQMRRGNNVGMDISA